MLLIELGNEGVHGGRVAEAADGVGPQGDGGGIAGGGSGSAGVTGGGAAGSGGAGSAAAPSQHAHGHTGRQQHGKLLLHSVLLCVAFRLRAVEPSPFH